MRAALSAVALLLVVAVFMDGASAQAHLIHHHYDFTTPGGHEVGVDVDIAASDYAAAIARADQQTEQEAVDAAVRWARTSTLPRTLREAADANHESPLAVVVAFVQSLPYLAGTGRALDPVEGLAEGQVDCDDRGLLAVGLAEALGIRAGLWVWAGMPHAGLGVVVDRPDAAAWHVSSVQHDGERYYYVELTAVGAPIGQTPREYTEGVELITPTDRAALVPSSARGATTPSTPGFRSSDDAGVPDASTGGSTRDEISGDDRRGHPDQVPATVTVFGAVDGPRGRAILGELHALDVDVHLAAPPDAVATRMGAADVGISIVVPGRTHILVNPTPDHVREALLDAR